MDKNKLLAGAAEIEITPALGTQIAGDIGRKRPARVVLEPLYAKALVLESGGVKLCFLSLDLLAATKDQSAIIRSEAERLYNIPKENITVHTVQNHSAPALGHFMVSESNTLLPEGEEWRFLRGGDDNFHKFCVKKVLDVIGEADGKKQPVRMGLAREIDGRFAFNRRGVMRDGRRIGEVRKCDPEILYLEGPVDPEVGVALFVNDALENIAVLLHHTSHPCSGYAHNYISSDWPGAWCDNMREVLGKNCVPLVVNGCCGNIVHDNKIDPDHDRLDYKKMGAGLAQSAVKALKKLVYADALPLKTENYHLQIPIRQFPEDMLDDARKLYKKFPMPKYDEKTNSMDWDWWIAVSALDVHSHWGPGSMFDYEIQAARVGDLGLVCLGGEPFVEGQLSVKLRSPSRYTFIAHMCNYYVGYVPIKEAVRNPATWDTRTSLGSKLDENALETIADNAVRMLEKLYG